MSLSNILQSSRGVRHAGGLRSSLLTSQLLQRRLLHVSIEQGSQLAIKDWLSSDPYCVVWLKSDPKKRRKTQVQGKNIDPIWMEYFCFELENVDLEKDEVVLECWDYSPISGDKYMGTINIPLASLGIWSNESKYYPLSADAEHANDEVKGFIKLSLLISGDIPSYDESADKLYTAVCLKNVKWEDPDFPTDLDGLVSSPEDIVWKRSEEYTENPQLFVDGASVEDVLPPDASMSAVGNQDLWHLPSATHQIIAQSVVNADLDLGFFQFQLYDHGKWKLVSIDDRIPCRKDGGPVFSHCKDSNELWVQLFEKAHAKLKGGYKALYAAPAMSMAPQPNIAQTPEQADGICISAKPLVIQAHHGISLDDVWNVVSDLTKYHLWNDFVFKVDVNGPIAVGTTILLHLNMGDQKITSPEMIDSYEPPHRVSWRFYNPWVPDFMLNSSHVQTVTKDEKTGDIIVQSWEAFKGGLNIFVKGFFAHDIKAGFDKQQEALFRYLKHKHPTIDRPLLTASSQIRLEVEDESEYNIYE